MEKGRKKRKGIIGRLVNTGGEYKKYTDEN